MKNRLWILFPLFLLASCNVGVDTSLINASPEETFSLLLKECMDDSFERVSGVSMAINSPLLSQEWNEAAGFIDQEKTTELSIDNPFRIASITKTYVAVAILRLHEMDSLNINDPISVFLEESFLMILKADGYNPDKILIKHCLNHTSGLADYAIATEDYINTIAKNPQKRWTRKEQLEGAMKWCDKLAEPGEQTTYCDTGYILLGAIIEKFFQGDLAAGLRHLLRFESLGLRDTWLETLENHPSENKVRVHRYLGPHETTNWDASIDLYGGGGLVSTTSDLASFFKALFDNKVYDKPSTLELMLSVPEYISTSDLNDSKKIHFYNYGLWTIKVFGNDVHMHNGIWGSTMLYIPAYKTSISVNTTRSNSDRLIKKVLLVLEQLNEQQ